MEKDKMKQPNCSVCYESIPIPDWMPKDDYDGDLVCPKCKSRHHVRINKSKIRKFKVIDHKDVNKEGSITLNFTPAENKAKNSGVTQNPSNKQRDNNEPLINRRIIGGKKVGRAIPLLPPRDIL